MYLSVKIHISFKLYRYWYLDNNGNRGRAQHSQMERFPESDRSQLAGPEGGSLPLSLIVIYISIFSSEILLSKYPSHLLLKKISVFQNLVSIRSVDP